MAEYNFPHEVAPQNAYLMLGITYVPHYTARDTFVGPGNITLSKTYLELFGAERVTLPLWPRHYPV